MNAYTTSSSPRGRSGEPEMVVQVLTTGFWPSYPTDADRLLILPPILVPLIDRFNSFYTSKYQVSLPHSLAYLLTHSLAYSLTHWLTHSLAYSLTHWLTHSLTN
jgi:hypothetical protein